MRSLAPLLMLAVLVCGCAISAAADQPVRGGILFGKRESHDHIQDQTSSFGPDDILAYVARLDLRGPSSRHNIHEYWTRVDAGGREHPVFNDVFPFPEPPTGFVTFRFPVAQLYKVGFSAPATYRVRLTRDSRVLAQGTFSLR